VCTLYSYEAAVLEIDSLLSAPVRLYAAGWRRHVHSARGGIGGGGGSDGGDVEHGANSDGPSVMTDPSPLSQTSVRVT
jgi:hypothetical protein